MEAGDPTPLGAVFSTGTLWRLGNPWGKGITRKLGAPKLLLVSCASLELLRIYVAYFPVKLSHRPVLKPPVRLLIPRLGECSMSAFPQPHPAETPGWRTSSLPFLQQSLPEGTVWVSMALSLHPGMSLASPRPRADRKLRSHHFPPFTVTVCLRQERCRATPVVTVTATQPRCCRN